MQKKVFFIIFTGLSVDRNCLRRGSRHLKVKRNKFPVGKNLYEVLIKGLHQFLLLIKGLHQFLWMMFVHFVHWVTCILLCRSQIYLGPYQSSMMELFAKIIDGFKKQPSRRVLIKSCSENMEQIYRRTPMPKCDFNKVFEIALRNGYSPVNLLPAAASFSR